MNPTTRQRVTSIDLGGGDSVELARHHIADVDADRPHALFINGKRVGMLDHDQADAIAAVQRLADDRLALGRRELLMSPWAKADIPEGFAG